MRVCVCVRACVCAHTATIVYRTFYIERPAGYEYDYNTFSQDPTFDKALHGMELLQQKLHSTVADQEIGVNRVGVDLEEEEEEDEGEGVIGMLGVRPLELENPLQVSPPLYRYQ